MRYTIILAVLSLGLSLYSFKTAYNETVKGYEYREAYESARNELQALYRTKGFKIDTAYNCKLKPNIK